jgi:hypothetical protein
VHKIRLRAPGWSNIEIGSSEDELKNYHIVMSHQQSTRCIITLLIIHHSRNRVTIQQTVTTLQQIVIMFPQTVITLQQIVITFPQTVITLLEDIRLVRELVNMGQNVANTLYIIQRFRKSLQRFEESLQRFFRIC